MQTVEHPFNEIPYQNVDPISLDDLNDSLFDGTINELGKTEKRPGMLEKLSLLTSEPVDGLFWWESQGFYLAISAGRTFKIFTSSGTFVELTGDFLLRGARPTFADNGNTVVIANGGRMVYTNGTNPTTLIADSDAPTQVSHVAFLDQFIIANEVGTARFHFADFFTAPTVWFAIDVFTAESNPDVILALYVKRRVIHLFGTQSVEFWFNDGISPFSRLQGTTLQRGTMSPYSTTTVNEAFYFFDERRRLTRMVGQTPEIINTSFDRLIQNFGTVSDAIGDYVTFNGRNWLIFTFPTERRSLIYDIQGNYWAEWSNVSRVTGTKNRFIANAYCYATAFNQHIFGSFKDSVLLQMDNNTFDDAGDQIKFEKTTGWIDYGAPDKRKRSYKLTFRLKAGVGKGIEGSESPFARIRWRDNGDTVWSNFRIIDLKKRGSREFNITLRSLGSYYSRQWNIQMFDDAPFIMGKVVETIDVTEF
jgi:hypothetical protein